MSTVIEINAETGEVIEREFTPAEKEQRKADADAAAKAAAEAAELEAIRAEARRKIAESSGLTPEEMAALGIV